MDTYTSGTIPVFENVKKKVKKGKKSSCGLIKQNKVVNLEVKCDYAYLG